MELRHLRYFTAVAEELHFRRAADRLHIAQPAVSEQIRNLERELGVQLLERTKRSVSLTPAGASLLDDARRMLRVEETARHAAQQAQAGVIGRLRIGRPLDALPVVVPRALRLFANAHPDVHSVVEQLDPRSAIEALRADLLDAAIVCLPAPLAGLDVVTIAEESAVVALPDGHPALGQAALPLEQLGGREVVMLARSVNPPFYDGVLAAARAASITIDVVDALGPAVEEALLVAATGRAPALLPASVAGRHLLAGVRFLPVAEPGPRCEVALVTRPDLDRAHVRAFARLLEVTGRRMAATPPARVASLQLVRPAVGDTAGGPGAALA